jgi:hypothetical protein
MTAKEFIEIRIKELISTLNYVEVFYEYKDSSDTHFVKILPKYVFDSENFSFIKITITKEFIEYDFPGSICFISDDSRVRLDGPTKVFSSYERDIIDRPIWNRISEKQNIEKFTNVSQNFNELYSLAA